MLNDSDIESNNLKRINDIDAFKDRLGVNPESRSDSENEALADFIAGKLGSSNRLPFLAVGYSGIPRSTIDRHLATASERGRTPVRLFMHLIARERLWQAYQAKKSVRLESEECDEA